MDLNWGMLRNYQKLAEGDALSQDNLPQFSALPNTLRTIGAYLDSKEAELIELHKRPISITLAYRDKSDHEHTEDRPVSSFYSFFRELFVKRVG